MARYVVQVVAGARTASILVVISPSQLCSALLDKVKSRLPNLSLGAIPVEVRITLHIDAPDGPILDIEDLLSDVLPNTTEPVYAVIEDLCSADGPVSAEIPPVTGPQDTRVGVGKALKIRVITPELAHSQPDTDTIPLLPANSMTMKSTLRDLKAQVIQHLGLEPDSTDLHDLRCNCSLARQIYSHATFADEKDEVGAMSALIVVCGNNRIIKLPVDEPIRSKLDLVIEQDSTTESGIKRFSYIGGVEDPQSKSSDDPKYLKLPVIALCGLQSHRDGPDKGKNTSTTTRKLVLDMHTSEVPIHLTSHNANLTLATVGLEDCIINGVLNIYAVKRFASGSFDDSQSLGKNSIYRQMLAWEHPSGQSNRGLANFLSSLRVFASYIASGDMEESEQDAILHVLMLLTKFPPAVRAVHVLMRGETPHASERAAIVQCIYEILKDVVPLRIIESDSSRLLEGSRLLFGLVIEKAKHLKITMHNPGMFPYLDSFKVHELRNMKTMEPVIEPIQTNSGLVDRELYNAFRNGSLLRWTDGAKIEETSTFDRKLNRACMLCGGVKSQVLSFDIDVVNSSRRFADQGDLSRVITTAEFSDLHYLANLCSRNNFGVIHPSALPSADPPVLTLDRAGLLAVYVGRQACGEAGRDINIFRPTSDIEEEAVDVSIITQLLIPILERRTADGTAIFEAFGDQSRQLKDPDEVLLLCIDASASMNDRCGFIDVEENEDEDVVNDMTSVDSEESNSENENMEFDRPALDELKEFLSAHESFDDFLAITQTGTDDFYRHRNAEKVLKILRGLLQQQIEEKAKELDSIKYHATHYRYRQQAQNLVQDIATSKNRIIRLEQYKDALTAFLLYRAENRVLDELLTWNVGDEMPQVPKQSQVPAGEKFEIPRELLCPISTELMEDPVMTVDGFTYERKNIERWFTAHETSPCTNLILESFDLRPDYGTKAKISAWVQGEDITSRYHANGQFNVCFKSPLSTITTALPQDLTMKDLYQKAFRTMKGRYASFALHHRNILLNSSMDPAVSHITSVDAVVISPIEAAAMSNSSTGYEELCLIKVYRGFDKPVLSYWERKTTTKTLASIVFRYYREMFLQDPYQPIVNAFTIWTNLMHTGDQNYSGHTRDHWKILSHFFNREDSKGRLVEEPVYDEQESEQQDSRFYPQPRFSHSSTKGLQPLVFKVQLSGKPRQKDNKVLTRLDVLKQMFDAYVNRLLAYGFNTHVGLVTFRSTASLTQEITHAIENFRHELNNITARGDTALWDAIMLAQDTLKQYAHKYPKAKLRIMCLSDGADTKSRSHLPEVAQALVHDHIIVDSFCLGEENNTDLKVLSYLTGGYKFQPDQMEPAMAICEMEPVLSSLERPDVVIPSAARRLHSNPVYQVSRAKRKLQDDIVTRDIFPRRKDHPLLLESFVELGHFSRGFDISSRSDSNLRLARIHNEIRNSGARPHPHYDVYVCESNFSMWKIVMQGPPDSTYASGTFVLYLEMGDEYPLFPPKGRFVTPIYHPNINRHGRICHSIFDRNWTVDTTTKDVIDTVYSLLLVPEFSDPINTVVTLNFHWDEVQFKEEAQRHIQQHASQTRAQWKRNITEG